MKAVFTAEAFGWGSSRQRERRRPFDVRRPHADELIGLDGSDYRCRWVRPVLDWRHMNSTGNRGAYFCWTLEAGRIYRVSYRESWTRWVDRLLTVTEDGAIVDVTEGQVRAWLANVTSG